VLELPQVAALRESRQREVRVGRRFSMVFSPLSWRAPLSKTTFWPVYTDQRTNSNGNFLSVARPILPDDGPPICWLASKPTCVIGRDAIILRCRLPLRSDNHSRTRQFVAAHRVN
jgi:hypothetical protein